MPNTSASVKDEIAYSNYVADCYVITDQRIQVFINSFLDKFIPHREETADEYEIPQYSDKPTIIYKKAEDLIDYMVSNKNEPHTIYWRNLQRSNLKGAMCFFTNDGKLILGLSCKTLDSDKSIERKYLEELREFCSTNDGYIAYEDPAPDNTAEFMDRVKKYWA